MAVYGQQNLGSNLSTFAGTDDAQDEAIRSHERGSVAPTIKPNGLVWFSTDATSITGAGFGGGVSEAALRWDGSDWVGLMDLAEKALNAGGTVAWEADQDADGHMLVGLIPGTDPDHSAAVGQVLLLDGSNPMAGDLDMDGNLITGLADGVADDDAATVGQLPVNGANIYHNNNRNTGGGGDPVVWKTTNGDVANYMQIDFRPKFFVIRTEGRFRNVSDNSDHGGLNSSGNGDETTFVWAPLDSTGGDDGRPLPYNFKTWISGGGYYVRGWVDYDSGTGRLTIEYKGYINSSLGGYDEHQNVRNDSSSGVDGTVQILAIG